MYKHLLLVLILVPQPAFGQGALATLEPLVSIGSVDGGHYALTAVSDLEVAPDGRIYIAQPQEQRLRVFRPDGTFLRYIGRSGEGPGEFRTIDNVGWLNDSLYVIDPRLSRVTLFSPSGQRGRTLTMTSTEVSGAMVPAPPARLLPDGSGLVKPRVSAQVVGRGDVRGVPILRIAPDGSTLDTITLEHWRGTGGAVASDVMSLSVPQPLPSHTLWGADPSSGAIITVERPIAESGEDSHFEVLKRDLDGDTLFRRRYGYRPKALAPAAADSILHGAVARIERLLGPRGEAALAARGMRLDDALRPALALPRFQPPISDMLVGRDGAIWLKREEVRSTNPRWVVLNPDGTIRYELETEPGVRILRSDGSRAWGVRQDEYGVEYVVVYRILEPE